MGCKTLRCLCIALCAAMSCAATACNCYAAEETTDRQSSETGTYPADDPTVKLALKLRAAHVRLYYRDENGRVVRGIHGRPQATSIYSHLKGPDENGRYRFKPFLKRICGFYVPGNADQNNLLSVGDIATIAQCFQNIEILSFVNSNFALTWGLQLQKFPALKELYVRLERVKAKADSNDKNNWNADDRRLISKAMFGALEHLESLEKLELTGCDLRDRDIAKLARLSRLRELSLLNDDYWSYRKDRGYILPVIDFKAETLSRSLAELKQLRVLNTTGCELKGRIDWAPLGRLPHLETLDIGWSGLDDDRLAGIERLGHLKTLDLSYSRITGKSLAAIAKLSELETLNLENTNVRSNILALAALPNLRQVDYPADAFQDYPLSVAELEFFIRSCKSGDRAYVRDAEAVPLTRINELVPDGIDGLYIKADEKGSGAIRVDVAKPGGGPRSRTRRFTIARRLSDRDFADIEKLTKLKYVDVSSSAREYLSDEQIASLSSLPKLTGLSLRLGRPITGGALSGLEKPSQQSNLALTDFHLDKEAMAVIGEMPFLEYFKLTNGKLEADALRQLARATKFSSSKFVQSH